jgi:hypothetical protein
VDFLFWSMAMVRQAAGAKKKKAVKNSYLAKAGGCTARSDIYLVTVVYCRYANMVSEHVIALWLECGGYLETLF